MGIDPLARAPRPAVFLDRDGTLNRVFVRDGVAVPPTRLEEVEILRGVPEALERLKASGFVLVVVTNQPDVARGTQSRSTVEEINALLRRELPLDAVFTCYHDDADRCACRKPAPGLVFDAAAQLGLCLPGSFLVGDRWRDVEAGRRAGCATVFLRTPHGGSDRAPPDFEAADLGEAAALILRCREERTCEDLRR